MDDFIKGDTHLIKELTDEINRLREELSEYEDINKKVAEHSQSVDKALDDSCDVIRNLKQQLAEKNKEIEEIKDGQKDICLRCGGLTHKEYEQSQNQTAIDELEKVIEFMKIENELGFKKSAMEIFMFIDQRINTLKGETNEQKA